MQIEFNKVTWYSKWGALILFLIVLPVLTFYIGREYQKTVYVVENNSIYIAEETSEAVEASADPLNATYSIDDEQITLVNGVAKTSGTETRIFGEPVKGDLNNDGKSDYVFFVSQETSGTGIFFYVVAAIQKNGSYLGTKAVFLGDRISPNNISISNGEAVVNYAVRKDTDPMTMSPSIGTSKYIRLENGNIIERMPRLEEISNLDPFDKSEELSIFMENDSRSNTSNVVGYIGRGAFSLNLPNWLADHWKMSTSDGNHYEFYPFENVNRSSFSNISVSLTSLTEVYNADSRYDYSLENDKNIILSEIFFNSNGDLRIYHTQQREGGLIVDNFYVDGNSMTARVHFSAKESMYSAVGPKIKEFMQGIGKGGTPQG